MIMYEDNMAANTDIEVSEELATPMNLQLFAEDDINVDPAPTDLAPELEPSNEPTPEPDITQTQAFSHRLKEETEKARNTERDNLIAEMYGESHGIRTYAEYQKAVAEQQRQAEIQRLVQENVPESYANEMMENRKFREQFETQKKSQEQKEQQTKQYQEFLEAYPEFSDPQKINEIPAEVWQSAKTGTNILDAYVRYENKSLKGELSKYQTQQQAVQANQANAASSTGSVKGSGLPDSGYISREVFDANKSNQSWMSKNYDSITKSMQKWGK